MFFSGASSLTVIIPMLLQGTEVLLYLLICWLILGMSCLIILCVVVSNLCQRWPKKSVVWQGKEKMGEIQFQFRCLQCNYLCLSLCPRLPLCSMEIRSRVSREMRVWYIWPDICFRIILIMCYTPLTILITMARCRESWKELLSRGSYNTVYVEWHFSTFVKCFEQH